MLSSIATAWTKNGLTQNRLTTQGAGDYEVVLRNETYAYDSGGRILTYTVTGTEPPQDAWGVALASQTCTWNAVGLYTVLPFEPENHPFAILIAD